MCDSILKDIIELSSAIAISGVSAVAYLKSRIHQEEIDIRDSAKGYAYFLDSNERMTVFIGESCKHINSER